MWTSPEKHYRQKRIKSLKIVVETSDENQYSYFYILNSFLKKAKKTMKWDLGYGVWGRALVGGGGWYISSAYQCFLHLLVTKFAHIIQDNQNGRHAYLRGSDSCKDEKFITWFNKWRSLCMNE